MKRWQLQDAKNRLSEVVERALLEGPQIVTRRGTDSVAIISMKDFQKLTTPRTSLVQFFSQSPLKGMPVEKRRKDLGRKVEL
ncbi:MAG: type II toxin-antitoxin system Phd/YefM family antitoxin [Deltaproteobacteria bacterium]|nr:type II toxin-antitoxin system Phd/YefM family antitoxin [Deltaproteobacteria bacterium]MBI3294869.1 type II toxin-antitoxin system Phd/YefM family antitoxin [Deltaproteobacteria bacterium]